jgi:hypothetical protein
MGFREGRDRLVKAKIKMDRLVKAKIKKKAGHEVQIERLIIQTRKEASVEARVIREALKWLAQGIYRDNGKLLDAVYALRTARTGETAVQIRASFPEAPHKEMLRNRSGMPRRGGGTMGGQ